MPEGFDDPKTAAEYDLYILGSDADRVVAFWPILRTEPENVAALALIRDRLSALLGDSA